MRKVARWLYRSTFAGTGRYGRISTTALCRNSDARKRAFPSKLSKPISLNVGDCVVRYSLDIKPSARKELESLSDNLIARIVPKIDSLAADPRPSGTKKLRGYKDLWRIRVGDYRIVYIIDDDRKMVSVTRVAHRRDVYGW